uniref:Uncharacterized protein n=1 Tax=Steinernema glaseri TaxID=37863 RepID=A0A1I7ZLD3_9BILA
MKIWVEQLGLLRPWQETLDNAESQSNVTARERRLCFRSVVAAFSLGGRRRHPSFRKQSAFSRKSPVQPVLNNSTTELLIAPAVLMAEAIGGPTVTYNWPTYNAKRHSLLAHSTSATQCQ